MVQLTYGTRQFSSVSDILGTSGVITSGKMLSADDCTGPARKPRGVCPFLIVRDNCIGYNLLLLYYFSALSVSAHQHLVVFAAGLFVDCCPGTPITLCVTDGALEFRLLFFADGWGMPGKLCTEPLSVGDIHNVSTVYRLKLEKFSTFYGALTPPAYHFIQFSHALNELQEHAHPCMGAYEPGILYN